MTRFLKLQQLFDTNKDNPQRLNEFASLVFSKERFSGQAVFEEFISFCFKNKEIREGYAHKIVERLVDLPENIDQGNLRLFLKEHLKRIEPKIDCSNFFYDLNFRYKEGNFNFLLTKEDLIEICEKRLEEYCSQNDNPLEAFGLLYLCWDHVDEENHVHLSEGSLEIIYKFIQKVPIKYLLFLIRPKYVPPMSFRGPEYVEFVFEPFTKAILGDWEKFDAFIKGLKPTNIEEKELIEKIDKLFLKYRKERFSQITLLKKELVEYSIIPAIKEVLLNR
jgi:hypothetical protein